MRCWQNLQLGPPSHWAQELRAMTESGDHVNIFLLSHSPKLVPCRPHLDYRCVLFGLQSVLKFFKISNNIYIERLHIETHLFSLSWNIRASGNSGFSFLLGSSLSWGLAAPFRQIRLPQSSPLPINFTWHISHICFTCLKSKFAISFFRLWLHHLWSLSGDAPSASTRYYVILTCTSSVVSYFYSISYHSLQIDFLLLWTCMSPLTCKSFP